MTCTKTTASITMKTVVHRTDLSLERYLDQFGGTTEHLIMERKHIKTEGWRAYEKRWVPGACPQENHIIHLTYVVTAHKLPEFAYERIRALIENGVTPEDIERYSKDPGEHFSTTREFSSKPSFSTSFSKGINALPMP